MSILKSFKFYRMKVNMAIEEIEIQARVEINAKYKTPIHDYYYKETILFVHLLPYPHLFKQSLPNGPKPHLTSILTILKDSLNRTILLDQKITIKIIKIRS